MTRPRPRWLQEDHGPQDRPTLGDKQERRLNKELGLQGQPASGAMSLPSLKGDGKNDQFYVEYKRDKRDKFTIEKHVLIKAQREAAVIGKEWAIGITIEGLPDSVPKDLFLIPKHLFDILLEHLK